MDCADEYLEEDVKSTKPKRKYKRSCWSKERDLGEEIDFRDALYLEESNRFIMSCSNYQKLLKLMAPHIKKQDTFMREAISANIRLLITLRLLATGNSYRELSNRFHVSSASISALIHPTLKSIFEVLSKSYFKQYNKPEEWKEIADNFRSRWNFPMCLGAIGGKHIAVKVPKDDEGPYVNYLKFLSVITIAAVDADYKFIIVDAKGNGAANDIAAFSSSGLDAVIENDDLNFPDNENLPGTNDMVPYVFISSRSYIPRILSPFRNEDSKMTNEEKIFNYRLSRAKSVVGKAFRLMSNRFKILEGTISIAVEKVEMLILACCALHNFLIIEKEDQEFMDKHDELAELEKSEENPNTWEEEDLVREMFSNYFNEIDVLPWQDDAINKFSF